MQPKQESKQKYYQKNKEKISARASKWYQDHKGYMAEWQRDYRKGKKRGRKGTVENPMTEEQRREWLKQMAEKEEKLFAETGDYCFCLDRRG